MKRSKILMIAAAAALLILLITAVVILKGDGTGPSITIPSGIEYHKGMSDSELLNGVTAEDSKDGGGAERQEKSRARSAVDRLHVLFTQRTREQRVHTDARAHGERDAQRLQREGERHGVHCVLTEPRDEHAVDNVVERIDQHG